MKEEYARRMEGWKTEGERIEEIAKKAENKIIKEMRESEEAGGRERKIRKEGWWDDECKEAKLEARREIRKWRKGKSTEKEYREKRKEYRKRCERKKKEERERLIREIAEVRDEQKVWEIINRERKQRKRGSENIELKEWKEYFMGLLGGVEGRARCGGERVRSEEEEEDISMEEVRQTVRKLKEGKAMGKDGIPNEAWKCGGEETTEMAWEICRRVWRGEGWPQEWKEGIIIPIIKKGEGKKVEEYRGVTLMPSLYKIYTTVLRKRLEREVEEGHMIPPNQTGFRKGVGTVDNIYVLNYIVNRQIEKEKGKIVVLFIDLKAAFDSVDREVLWEAMERRGVRKGLRERIKEIYGETISRVKIGEEVGEKFWTVKGVRQGCPLNPFCSTC